MVGEQLSHPFYSPPAYTPLSFPEIQVHFDRERKRDRTIYGKTKALISSIIQTSRHFIVVKDYAAPKGASDRYAPFYGNKIGRFVTSKQHHNR